MLGIPALLIGAPLPVKTGEDYPTRIGVLMQFLQNAKQTGKQLPPEGIQRIVERLGGLLQAYAQQDNNGGKQLASHVQQFLAASGYLQNSAPQQQPAQMAPATPQPAPAPVSPAPPPVPRKIQFQHDQYGKVVGATEVPQ